MSCSMSVLESGRKTSRPTAMAEITDISNVRCFLRVITHQSVLHIPLPSPEASCSRACWHSAEHSEAMA